MKFTRRTVLFSVLALSLLPISGQARRDITLPATAGSCSGRNPFPIVYISMVPKPGDATKLIVPDAYILDVAGREYIRGSNTTNPSSNSIVRNSDGTLTAKALNILNGVEPDAPGETFDFQITATPNTWVPTKVLVTIHAKNGAVLASGTAPIRALLQSPRP